METVKIVAEVVLEKTIVGAKWVVVKVKSVDWAGLAESVRLSLVNLRAWLKDHT
jgi:hypothetical protein